MWKHFFPDEPLMRSLGMTELHWLIDDSYITDTIKKGASVAAVNEKEEILAIRLGVVKKQKRPFLPDV